MTSVQLLSNTHEHATSKNELQTNMNMLEVSVSFGELLELQNEPADRLQWSWITEAFFSVISPSEHYSDKSRACVSRALKIIRTYTTQNNKQLGKHTPPHTPSRFWTSGLASFLANKSNILFLNLAEFVHRNAAIRTVQISNITKKTTTRKHLNKRDSCCVHVQVKTHLLT